MTLEIRKSVRLVCLYGLYLALYLPALILFQKPPSLNA